MIISCKGCGNLFGEKDTRNDSGKEQCPFCSETSLYNIEQRLICVNDIINGNEILFLSGKIYEVIFEHEKAFEVIDQNGKVIFVYKHEINKYFNRIFNTATIRKK